jgi:hypothetical protein
MLRGYREWDEVRKAREASVEQLDIARLHRKAELPSGLTRTQRLDLVLDFLRETPWAKNRISRRKKKVPQGSYVTLKRRGIEESSVDVLAFILGLSFRGLEMTDEGQLCFQFEAHRTDNCHAPIVIELDTGIEPFGAHRYRSDASTDLDGLEDRATFEFIEERVGEAIIAAWEDRSLQDQQICLLWSDGMVSVTSRTDDTIWINVVDDIQWVIEEAPYAAAIAVVVGSKWR